MPLTKSRIYCCICSNYRGKEVDERVISLHRFPVDEKRRKIWLLRSRLVRKDFVYSANCQMCSAHFVGGRGPYTEHTLPSIFPNKIYKTSNTVSFEESCAQEVENKENQDPVQYPGYENEDIQHQLPTVSGLHVPEPQPFLHMAELQEENRGFFGSLDFACPKPSMVNTATQTDQSVFKPFTCRPICIEAATQTPFYETTECGIQVTCPALTFDTIKHDDQKVLFYTGLPDAETFHALFDEIKDDAMCQTARNGASAKCGRPRHLRLVDEFFLVLMRLRLGLLLEDLADRFYIGTSTCSVIFNKWIDYLDVQLEFLVQWPSREVIDEHMPSAFREKYPKCRIILDCTELKTETPASPQNKSLMYSDYKSHMTWKGLIGISPAGVVTYVSDLWTGSVSDKQITAASGLIEMCDKGDVIMADKGFLISDMTTPHGVNLVIPPFKQGKKQLSKREVGVTRTIANLRIHVERQMERVKNFNILKSVIPISMAHKVSKIWKLCVRLTTLQPPLCNK